MNSSMYRNLTHYCFVDGISHHDSYYDASESCHSTGVVYVASHVPIFLAMFLSRKMAACVVIGSTLGFFVAGFPLVIVMRAASHIIFALMGAYYIKHHPGVLTGALSFATFNLVCAIVHAIGEVLACLLFYTTTTMPNIDLIYVVFVLVGGGTIIHSMVDGYIALYIYKAIPGLSKTGNQ